MKEFHRRDFANRTGLAQAWTVKSADRLFTRDVFVLKGSEVNGRNGCRVSIGNNEFVIIPRSAILDLAFFYSSILDSIENGLQ